MKEKIRFFYGIEVAESEQVFFEDLDAKKKGHNAGNFTIEAGNFLQFPVQFLDKIVFDEDKIKGLSQICDGIAIELLTNTLLFVEVKTTIGFRTYKKILAQLSTSYIKMQTLLGVIEKCENWKVNLFIIGNFLDENNEDETMNSKEGEMTEQEKIYQSYWRLIKHRTTHLDLPHNSFLLGKVAAHYHKKDIQIQHFSENSTYIFNK